MLWKSSLICNNHWFKYHCHFVMRLSHRYSMRNRHRQDHSIFLGDTISLFGSHEWAVHCSTHKGFRRSLTIRHNAPRLVDYGHNNTIRFDTERSSCGHVQFFLKKMWHNGGNLCKSRDLWLQVFEGALDPIGTVVSWTRERQIISHGSCER